MASNQAPFTAGATLPLSRHSRGNAPLASRRGECLILRFRVILIARTQGFTSVVRGPGGLGSDFGRPLMTPGPQWSLVKPRSFPTPRLSSLRIVTVGVGFVIIVGR